MTYERAHALDVLHDPTRRRVLELLRNGERSVGELTDQLPVSQPAVSQHLGVLKSAGLVSVRPVGTRRLYRVDPDGLSAVRAWVDSFWDDALAAFVEHAEQPHAEPATTDGDSAR
jgi:DNA-binding transcriptional ArsR family regulator